ncbi:MAG: hypothetical protein KKA19_06245 [Candidatus Margulisbacteria bacterium]|nr:hypothetical protein [Candidatus Margulisiibacteriota bacterium]
MATIDFKTGVDSNVWGDYEKKNKSLPEVVSFIKKLETYDKDGISFDVKGKVSTKSDDYMGKKYYKFNVQIFGLEGDLYKTHEKIAEILGINKQDVTIDEYPLGSPENSHGLIKVSFAIKK